MNNLPPLQLYVHPASKLYLFPISDSIAVMSGYADVVVLRHPEPGAVSVSSLGGMDLIWYSWKQNC